MPRERPNILLLTSHDTGDWFHCCGHTTVSSPSIDALAAEGIRFSRHFCTSPVCTPSRGAMLTGRYPQTNGLMGLVQTPYSWRYRKGERHLSHILKDAGYQTVLVHHQHETRELEQLGFQTAIGLTRDEYFSDSYRRFRPASEVAERVADYLSGEAGQSRPFYAQVGFFETHTPHDFGGSRPYDAEGVEIPPHISDDEQARRKFASLQGSVRSLDNAIGIIVEALKETGLADNTIVVLTVDHGPEFPRSKWCVYDAGIRTALIIRWPEGGIVGGRSCSHITSNVDLLPTLLELIDGPVPENVQGRSFVAAALNPDAEPARDTAFAMMHSHYRWHEARCIRTESHKLIWNFSPSRERPMPCSLGWRGRGPERPVLELYDIEADPWEMNNLAEEKSPQPLRTELHRRLMDWMQSVQDPILEGPIITPYFRKAMDSFTSYRT